MHNDQKETQTENKFNKAMTFSLTESNLAKSEIFVNNTDEESDTPYFDNNFWNVNLGSQIDLSGLL